VTRDEQEKVMKTSANVLKPGEDKCKCAEARRRQGWLFKLVDDSVQRYELQPFSTTLYDSD
jgi:hypothetical protein